MRSDLTIQIRYDAESQLRSEIEKFDRYVLLGEDSEAPREYILMAEPENRFAIGIIASGTGIAPSSVYFEREDLYFVGFDATVIMVDPNSQSQRMICKFLDVFYDFFNLSESSVIVINELGASKLTSTGDVVWRFEAEDIVSNWELGGEQTLRLTLIDGRELEVCVP